MALPQWYARFSLEPAVVVADFAASRYGEDRNARVGPFTVFRRADGCDVATFGSTADPGAVLFDGYLFDRAATRRDLGLDVNASDATIAAAAYQRWGLDVFDRLDGSYLIAIWDPLQRRLLLGHEPLGHHPVFYADRPDAFWFTSNVLAMPAAGVVPNEADRVSFAMAALLYWPAAGHTFYQQVQRLRPGHYLAVAADRAIRETHYWSPWLDDDEPGLTEKQAWEQFEPMLVDAIGRCMELTPDSIMLSGGLDSVTIAALAADHSRANGSPLIRAVSGRRDFPPSDEEPMQTAVAAALRMEHLVARESEWIGTRSGVDLSLDAVRELPGSFAYLLGRPLHGVLSIRCGARRQHRADGIWGRQLGQCGRRVRRARHAPTAPRRARTTRAIVDGHRWPHVQGRRTPFALVRRAATSSRLVLGVVGAVAEGAIPSASGRPLLCLTGCARIAR